MLADAPPRFHSVSVFDQWGRWWRLPRFRVCFHKRPGRCIMSYESFILLYLDGRQEEVNVEVWSNEEGSESSHSKQTQIRNHMLVAHNVTFVASTNRKRWRLEWIGRFWIHCICFFVHLLFTVSQSGNPHLHLRGEDVRLWHWRAGVSKVGRGCTPRQVKRWLPGINNIWND